MKSTTFDLQKTINDDFRDFHPLIHLSQKLRVSPASLLCGTLLLLFVMLMNGILGDFPLYFIGCVYPMYKSIISLRYNLRPQIKFWLIYWMIFMAFIEFKRLFRILLIFLPKNVYNVLMAISLIGLYYPRSRLIGLFHQKVIKPNSKKLEKIEEKIWRYWNEHKSSKIEEKIEKIDKKIGKFLDKIVQD